MSDFFWRYLLKKQFLIILIKMICLYILILLFLHWCVHLFYVSILFYILPFLVQQNVNSRHTKMDTRLASHKGRCGGAQSIKTRPRSASYSLTLFLEIMASVLGLSQEAHNSPSGQNTTGLLVHASHIPAVRGSLTCKTSHSELGKKREISKLRRLGCNCQSREKTALSWITYSINSRAFSFFDKRAKTFSSKRNDLPSNHQTIIPALHWPTI